MAHKVVRNSAFGLTGLVAIKIVSFLFTILVVRRLGADVYGEYAAILAFCSSFAILSDLGLSPYSVRLVARWQDDPDGREKTESLYGNLLGLRLVLSAFTTITLIGAAWLTHRPLIMIGAIALNCVNIFIYSLHGVTDSILMGQERGDLSSTPKVIQQVLFVAGGTVALFLGWGYYGLTAASILAVAFMAYMNWRFVRRLGFRPRPGLPKQWLPLLRASLPFGIISVALGLSYRFDSILLNLFRNNAETGYYNAAYNLVFSAVILSNVINTSLYPSLSRQVSNDQSSLPGVTARMVRYLLLASLPIAMGVSLLSGGITQLLFAEGYSPSAIALRIVIWVVPFMYASEFLGYVVLVSNRENRVARAVLISSAINVGLNLMLVPRFGFIAAAVMTVLTEVVLVSQHTWTLRSIMAKFDWFQVVGKPVLAVAVMGIVTYLIRDELHVLLVILISALVYAAIVGLSGAINRDDFAAFKRARSVSPSVDTQGG